MKYTILSILLILGTVFQGCTDSKQKSTKDKDEIVNYSNWANPNFKILIVNNSEQDISSVILPINKIGSIKKIHEEKINSYDLTIERSNIIQSNIILKKGHTLLNLYLKPGEFAKINHIINSLKKGLKDKGINLKKSNCWIESRKIGICYSIN